MFKLGSIRALNIAKRRIVLDKARGHQIIQLDMLVILLKLEWSHHLPPIDISLGPIGQDNDGRTEECQSSC